MQKSYTALVLLLTCLFWPQNSDAEQIGAPCNADIWKYIHSPDRFHVIAGCVAVRGTVVGSVRRNFYDGDAVFNLRPDPESAIALRKLGRKMDDLRIGRQHGLIRVEIICVYAVKAKWWICSGYQNRVPIPKPGDSVIVSAPYVQDGHGRIELHGPSDIEIFRTAKQP
jgi:hypothetical protein